MTVKPKPWRVNGEQTLHTSPWLRLTIADVETPSGSRQDYECVHATYDGAAALVVNAQDEVLLLGRHRFIPGNWGWELPAGGVAPGESPITAAVREVREETGWLVRDARLVWSLNRLPERSDHRGHLVTAVAVRQVDEPCPDEAPRLGWWPRHRLSSLIEDRQVADVFTVAALLLHSQADPS